MTGPMGGIGDKSQYVGTAMTTIKTAMYIVSHDNLKIDPTKESPVIKFLEKAYGLSETGKPSEALLTALGVKDLKEIDGKKIAAAIEKLEAEGKMGKDAYKKDGDASYLHALSDALKPIETPGKAAANTAATVGGWLNRIPGMGGAGGLVTGAGQMAQTVNMDQIRQGYDAILPPRSAGLAPSGASPSATPGNSAPTTPAQATPTQPSTGSGTGGVSISAEQKFSFNQALDGIIASVGGVGNAPLKINENKVEQFDKFLKEAVKSLLPNSDPKDILKAVNEYSKSKGLPEVTNLRELTGNHVATLMKDLKDRDRLDVELVTSGNPKGSLLYDMVDAMQAVKIEGLARIRWEASKLGIERLGPRPAIYRTSAADLDTEIVVASADTGVFAKAGVTLGHDATTAQMIDALKPNSMAAARITFGDDFGRAVSGVTSQQIVADLSFGGRQRKGELPEAVGPFLSEVKPFAEQIVLGSYVSPSNNVFDRATQEPEVMVPKVAGAEVVTAKNTAGIKVPGA